MLRTTTKCYKPGQLLGLGLVVMVLAASSGWSFVQFHLARAYNPETSSGNSSLSVSKAMRVRPTGAGGQVQFDSATYTTTEGAAGKLVTVTRTGSSSGAISATVVLTDVTTSLADYQFPPTAGSLDPNFAPVGSGPTDRVSAIAVQPVDGKVIIGGEFNLYNNTSAKYLARLNADSTLDTNFNAGGIGPNGFVYGVAVQADGKILIGGLFTAYNGIARNRLARLNSDGSLDPSFVPAGSGPNNFVNSIAVQPTDGKILIGGYFSAYNNNTSAKYLARLNTDGSLDTTFNAGGTGPDAPLAAVTVQSVDGNILIGGGFTTYNGTSRSNLARLNPNGTLDPTFIVSGSGINNWVNGITVQTDGKIVIGGYFTAYIGRPNNHLARLYPDGRLDPTLAPVGSGPNDNVLAVALQGDGKILLGGTFTSYNGTPRNYLARLSGGPSGLTLDWPDGDSSPRSFVITATDDTLSEPTETAVLGLSDIEGGATAGSPVTATFAIVDNDPPQLLQFSTSTYTATEGAAGQPITVNRVGSASGAISATVVLTDVTTSPADYQFPPLAGSSDPTFAPVGSGPNISAYGVAIAVQAGDGKILVGGTFTNFNGVAANGLVRLNTDGTLDATFNAGGTGPNGGGPYNSVSGIVVQPDGKILIGGSFTTYNGTPRKDIARLNSDGTLDPTFNSTGSGFDSSVGGLAIQPGDGKILVGGYFTSYNNIFHNYFVRLNTDGSLDNSFNPGGFGPDQAVNGVAVQGDGKILIVGLFNSYRSVPRKSLARLNSDGTLDPTFNSDGTNVNGWSVSVAVQPNDGKILVGGSLTSYMTVPVRNLARLDPDGTLDPTFSPVDSDPNGTVVSGIVVQTDTKILVGGILGDYNSTPHKYLARLNGGIGGLILDWPDGDSSPRSFVITATSDTLSEPTEMASLGLINLKGGVSGGSPVTATFAILDSPPASAWVNHNYGYIGDRRWYR